MILTKTEDFRVDLGRKVYAEVISRGDRWWGVYKRSEDLQSNSNLILSGGIGVSRKLSYSSRIICVCPVFVFVLSYFMYCVRMKSCVC